MKAMALMRRENFILVGWLVDGEIDLGGYEDLVVTMRVG